MADVKGEVQVYFSYGDLFHSYNFIVERFLKLKQRFKILFIENEKLQKDKLAVDE